MDTDDKKYEYTNVIISPSDWKNLEAYNKLLANGWKPLRETPNHPPENATHSYWFCVLSREKASS